jgi:hypothetical protein
MDRPWRAAAAVAAALVIVAGCDRRSGDPPDGSPRIELDIRDGHTTIAVVGLPAADLARLRDEPLTTEQWSQLLRVVVAGERPVPPDVPAMLGVYRIDGPVLRFTPQFPFDPGQRYEAVLDPSRLPAPGGQAARSPWRRGAIAAVFHVPGPDGRPTTRVVRLFPSGDEIPENTLRLYIRFSEPMSLEGGRNYVHLVDEADRPVDDPFIPLDVSLWNEDRTRYTLLFDPGRVKRGIAPNEQMGRPLVAGRRYTLVVDQGWRDGHGRPLAEQYRRTFRVGAPQENAIDTSAWQIAPPRGGTRDPLTVSFPHPLDYALLARALSVSRASAEPMSGEMAIDDGERAWRFFPRGSWAPGEYTLVVSPTLEDVAGNRIGRPFELAIASDAPVGGHAKAAVLLFRVSP